MNKAHLFAALASLAIAAPSFAQAADAPAPSATPVPATMRGKMLVDATGGRLAQIYRIDAGGSAQIVYEGRMITVPASTLSVVNGKVTTSLKKTDVIALR